MFSFTVESMRNFINGSKSDSIDIVSNTTGIAFGIPYERAITLVAGRSKR